MAFRNGNKFIPKYVPNYLKWYKKDCLDGLDTDEHFKKMKVVNFDMIKNKVSQ